MRPALLLLALATPALAGPGEAYALAARDVRTLDPVTATRARYFTTAALREEEKAALLKALWFHVNSLSREAEFAFPRPVGPDLYRVDLLDYAWDARTWEKLADVEPYFHVKLQGGTVRGKGPRVPRVVTAQAPWLPAAEAAYLVNRTQSQVPVVRADWFLFQTSRQVVAPGYYDFLGLGNKEADFLRLIGADKDAARRLRKEIAANLAKSGVAIQNRGIIRMQAITGPYWFTQDYKTSTNKQNVLRLLDGDTEPPAGDASEQYGTLSNGLPAYWLQDAQGNRQDSVPDFIAHDHTAVGNDLRIFAGKSCIGCHAEVIRPIDDWSRKLYRGAIKLQSPDYAKSVRLRQLYLSDLDGQVSRDQADYARAIARCNGLSPAENARGYARAFDAYLERDLTPGDVAREIGVTEAMLLDGLKKYAATAGQLDPVLAGLIQTPPVPVRREHAEEAVPLLYLALKGYVP